MLIPVTTGAGLHDLQHALFIQPGGDGQISFPDVCKYHVGFLLQAMETVAQGSTVTIITGYFPVCRLLPDLQGRDNFMAGCTGPFRVGRIPPGISHGDQQQEHQA